MRTHLSPVFRPPDWTPLERALAAEFGEGAVNATASFWFIGFAEGPADVGELRLYEHSATRRRIVLDADAGAYAWFPEISGYSRIPVTDALINVLR